MILTRSNIYKFIIIPLIPVLLFAIFEIILRAYQGYCPDTFMPDSTYLSYRGTPFMEELNGFHLNSKGYKDEEFRPKKPGSFRIIAVGDSQAYGAVPYPDCCLTILDARIKGACPACEILNMGVPAAGPVDYLSLLINEGIDMNPDLVLLMLYLGDDFKNGGSRYRWHSYSAAATLVNSVIANRWPSRGRVFAAGSYSEDRPVRGEKAYAAMMAASCGELFIKQNGSFIRDFRGVMNILGRIKAFCDRRHIGLAVILCPSDVQIYPELRETVMRALRVPEGQRDFEQPDRMLKEGLSKLNVPVLDLLESFTRDYKENKMHFNQGNDPHWNRRGNKFAAGIILPWLTGVVDSEKGRKSAGQK